MRVRKLKITDRAGRGSRTPNQSVRWLGLAVEHADYASEKQVKFIEDDARRVHLSRHEDL